MTRICHLDSLLKTHIREIQSEKLQEKNLPNHKTLHSKMSETVYILSQSIKVALGSSKARNKMKQNKRAK